MEINADNSNIKINYLKDRKPKQPDAPKEFVWEGLCFVAGFIVPDEETVVFTTEDKIKMTVKFLNDNNINLQVPLKYMFEE